MSDERPTADDGIDARSSDDDGSERRPRHDSGVIELDESLRSHVADAFAFDAPPTTFRELWERMLATFEAGLGRPVNAADLCTTDASPHRAVVDGDSQAFQCVTDAFIYAGLVGGDARVRTVSPVEGRGLTVDFGADAGVSAPDGSVLSVGVERGERPPDGPVTPERMYGRFCPYSNAFASREEYERWSEARPGAATQALPLDDALALLADLTGRTGAERRRVRGDPGAGERCSCATEVER